MGANIAGIYGAQLLRKDDNPLYRRGFSVNCAILAAGLVVAIVRFVDDRIRRKRNTQIQPEVGMASSDNDVEGKTVQDPSQGQAVVLDADTKAALGR